MFYAYDDLMMNFILIAAIIGCFISKAIKSRKIKLTIKDNKLYIEDRIIDLRNIKEVYFTTEYSTKFTSAGYYRGGTRYSIDNVPSTADNNYYLSLYKEGHSLECSLQINNFSSKDVDNIISIIKESNPDVIIHNITKG